MRTALLCFTIAVAYAVDMPFFFDATRAPEIFRDQLGMREAMDVWGQMIRKMTNGEKPDNVRQQVLRPKKVDKSVLKTLPKARGEIINERLLNMLLPRVRQETIDPVRDNLLSSSLSTSTSKPSTILTTLKLSTTTEPSTTVKETTTIKAATTTSAAPVTTTTSTFVQKETTVMKLTSIDHSPEHADEDKKPVPKKNQKKTEETVQEKETIIKNPKLSVRIHTANETQTDTMDSAVMSILMEKIDDRKISPKNKTETGTTHRTTSLVPEYTEEIRSRNVLKEKNLESEELFKDHEASSLLLHGSELLDTANSSTIADIKQLIEKIEQEVSNSTEADKVTSSKKVLSTTTASVFESTETMKVTSSKKSKTHEKMDDETETGTNQNQLVEQTEKITLDDDTTTPLSQKTAEESDKNSTEKIIESGKLEKEKKEDEEENDEEEEEDEASEEVSEEAEDEENDEVQEDKEEEASQKKGAQDSTNNDADTTDEETAENKKSTMHSPSMKQNRIPEAEDESDDSPAFIQSDDVNEVTETTTRRSVDGDVSSAGTVFNIEANANSDSKPVQTSVITPITGILDTIRPLMYYFTRPMQAAGVKSFDPENDPNYYGYQKVDSPQQLTLSDLTANIAKRLLSSGSNKPDKSRWNPSSIQDLQKNILENYGRSSNSENQLIPLEKIAKSSTEAPAEPQVLTVEGSSQKVETEYYAPVLPKERNTLPIVARPSFANFKKTKSTKKFISTTTERTTTVEATEEEEQTEEFDDGSASSVETNFLGDSGVLLGNVNMPEPEIKEAIPFALHPVTDEEPFPITYKTFGGGSFGGGRRPSIPLTDETGSSSDILSFFDSKQR